MYQLRIVELRQNLVFQDHQEKANAKTKLLYLKKITPVQVLNKRLGKQLRKLAQHLALRK